MKMRCFFKGHIWKFYFYDTMRSCKVCNRVEQSGMSGDPDDYFYPADSYAIKGALCEFLGKFNIHATDLYRWPK